MDAELAEVLEQLDTGEKKAPKLQVSEATPMVLQQREIIALLRQLVQMQASKRIQFPPLPLLITAASLLAEERRAEHRGRLLRLVEQGHAQWRADHPDEAESG